MCVWGVGGGRGMDEWGSQWVRVSNFHLLQTLSLGREVRCYTSVDRGVKEVLQETLEIKYKGQYLKSIALFLVLALNSLWFNERRH